MRKKYSQQLKDDELFFIEAEFEKDKVSILFSNRALLNNLIKQNQMEPSLIHIDATYKLIDIGLPLITLSTETIAHNYRPIAFLMGGQKVLNKFLAAYLSLENL